MALAGSLAEADRLRLARSGDARAGQVDDAPHAVMLHGGDRVTHAGAQDVQQTGVGDGERDGAEGFAGAGRGNAEDTHGESV